MHSIISLIKEIGNQEIYALDGNSPSQATFNCEKLVTVMQKSVVNVNGCLHINKYKLSDYMFVKLASDFFLV